VLLTVKIYNISNILDDYGVWGLLLQGGFIVHEGKHWIPIGKVTVALDGFSWDVGGRTMLNILFTKQTLV
jgi:hypothetical protein